MLASEFGASYLEEVVGFLILVGLIWRIALPPLGRLMSRREATIRDQLAAGDEARAAAEQLVTTRRAGLEAARREAVLIVEQANRSCSQLVVEGHERATLEAERFVARASAEVDQALARVRDEVVAELCALVVDAARLVVEAELGPELHHRLIGEAIAAAETEAL